MRFFATKIVEQYWDENGNSGWRDVSDVALRLSQIDRIDASYAGVVQISGNTGGKGPVWSVRVRGNFQELIEMLEK